MISQGRAGNRPAKLASLLALAPSLRGWFARSASIGLAPDVVVTAGDTEWIGRLSAHADRSLTDPRKVESSVILTMFCRTAPRTRRDRVLLRAWQRRITEQLRALGYQDDWRERPRGVPSANYFSKEVARLAQIPPAVRKLQRVRF